MAIKWLRECLETHDLCQPHEEAFLPKRLVSLPRLRNEDPVLVDSETIGQVGSTLYACLSHCWGKGVLCQTTKTTVDTHKQGIPWIALSKTFQEVIIIALDLGIHFIWIDSLCIIQDDEADVGMQVGEMASIFENCHITVAALASAVGNGGCYRRSKSLDTITACKINELGEIFTACCRRFIQHPDPIYGSNDHSIQAPLMDRAWAYQEYELSPRVLNFEAVELIWACNGSIQCECSQIGAHLQKAPIPHACTPEEMVVLSERWQSIVESYSGKKLTYTKDKLPALSGLAKRMQKQLSHFTRCRYLAGLWDYDLPLGLAWHFDGRVATDLEDDKSSATYRAPSWSWASRNGPVRYTCQGFDKFRPMARILDVTCNPSGSDPTGAVSGGFLTISSPLISVQLKDSVPGKYRVIYEGSQNIFNARVYNDYAYAIPGENLIPPGQTLFCLLLGYDQPISEQSETSTEWSALLLRASRNADGSFKFIRVGLANGSNMTGTWFDDAPIRTITII